MVIAVILIFPQEFMWANEYASTPAIPEGRKVSPQRFISSLHYKDKYKGKDSFTGPQEFVVGYSKAPEQPQSSARPVYVILML